MRKQILFFIMLVPLLFTCTTRPVEQPPLAEWTASQFPIETYSLLPTASLASQPTSTFTPSPSITATFEADNIRSRTPASPAQCPVEKPELVPTFEYSSFTSESVDYFYTQVLDFLNAGGTRQAVVAAYGQRTAGVMISDVTGDNIVQEKDITGDGVPELVLTDSNTMDAFICQNGEYQGKNLLYQTYHFTQPVIVDIIDMNLDSVGEVIAMEGDASIRFVSVLEWDGNAFQLLNSERGSRWDPLQSCSDLLGSSWVYAQDTDGNGTLELVLKQDIPIGPEYGMGLPWRKETRICTWNGTAFVLSQRSIDTPPVYRFQAIQDGDVATRAGQYNQALALYQQAISSNTLLDWSPAWRIYEMEKYNIEGVDPSPTPRPTPVPDLAEYANLSAYAHFRMLLLYIVQNDVPEAKTIYDTLQQEYPESRAGHVYAEMATLFWNEYQHGNTIEQACATVTEYAFDHPAETLSRLGNGEFAVMYFGDQSLTYRPKDLCPFQ